MCDDFCGSLLSLSLPLSHTHILAITTHTIALSLSHFLRRTHSVFPARTHSRCHNTFSLSFSLSLSLSFSLSLSTSLYLTHTRTHNCTHRGGASGHGIVVVVDILPTDRLGGFSNLRNPPQLKSTLHRPCPLSSPPPRSFVAKSFWDGPTTTTTTTLVFNLDRLWAKVSVVLTQKHIFARNQKLSASASLPKLLNNCGYEVVLLTVKDGILGTLERGPSTRWYG